MKIIENSILIIGKSKIALRYFKILSKLSKKQIFFLDKQGNILFRKQNLFLKTNSKLSKNLKFFLVIICTPSIYHVKYLIYFLNKSKFILCEKPLSNNYKKSKMFYNYIRHKKILPKIYIGYNLRFTKILLYFYNFLKKESLGEIYYVRSSVGKSLKLWRDGNLNFACTKKNLGGGALLELSHEIDYLQWCFGDLKIINKYLNPKKFFNFDVEQNVFTLFKSKNYKKNFPVLLSIDIIRQDPVRECEVICEKGTIKMDIIKSEITIIKKNKSKKINFSKNDVNQSYKKQVNFILSKQFKSIQNVQNSIKILKLIDQIKKK